MRNKRSSPDLPELIQRWADGKATLKDVRGYSSEELYTVAKLAYFFYYQGKRDEARTLFQGLYAINPADPYVAKALGVVELASGNAPFALQAYDVAIKLAPDDPFAYAGRAEVRLYLGQKGPAIEDLKQSIRLTSPGEPLNTKVSAMLSAVTKRS